MNFKCDFCGAIESAVIETRYNKNGIHRRRECLYCGERKTSQEIISVRYAELLKKEKELERIKKSIKSLKFSV